MKQRIKEVMGRAFAIEAASIPDDAAIGTLPGWDSLGHVTLMMGIEQEFGVSLTTEAMRQALTLAALEDYVTQAQAK